MPNFRRIEPVKPIPVPPRTDRDVQRVVEAACRFIQRVVDEHGRALALQVGDYMYVRVLGADDEYMRSRHRSKDRSYRDIAAATGLKYRTLWGWTRAAVARRKLAEHGLDTTLGVKHLEHVARLIDDIEAAAAIARWAEHEGATAKQLQQAVRIWKAHLDAKKDLSELLEDPPCPPKPRRRGRKGGGSVRPDENELLVPRILEMIGRWIDRVALPVGVRERIRTRLVRMRRLVAGAGR